MNKDITLNDAVMRIGEIVRYINYINGHEIHLSQAQINRIFTKTNEIAMIFNCADILKVIEEMK